MTFARPDSPVCPEYRGILEPVAWSQAKCIAYRMRQLRERYGWSRDDLAGRLGQLGLEHLDAEKLRLIEKGERQVQTDELRALAVALRVAPNHLEVLDDDTRDEEGRPVRIQVTPRISMTPRHMREWMKGDGGPPDGEMKVFYSNRPAYERERMLEQSKRAGEQMLERGLVDQQMMLEAVDPSDVSERILRDGPHHHPRRDRRSGRQ